MNESLGKTTTTTTTTSSVAITEKKTHRPGGCVGIFFQLFDWNRRFAKKKLFSKTLLPPVRSKHASKKFRGDERMPMLHLIADENKGGFPNMKKHGTRSVDLEHSYETRSPSLVARLMGLESLPAICEKPKKGFSDGCGNGEKKFVNEFCGGSGKEGMILERGSVKQIESRPQKLQKTGRFERKAVTKFGAEAVQIKSVLSRSRKHHHHHHPKFVSPVKSPRIPSGKNVSRTSRLFDAASKILEPGLQSTCKAKCAITYSSSVRYPPNNEVATETVVVKSEELPKQSCYGGNVAKSLMGQSSCKNCGNLLDVVDCRPNVDDGPSAFPSFGSSFVSGSPSEGTERSKPRLPVSSFGQKNEEVFHRSWDQPVSQKKEEMVYAQLNTRPITEQKSLPHEGQAPWQSLSQPCNFQSSQSSSFDLKHRVRIQEQTPLGQDRILPRSKVNNLDTRRVSSAANAVRGTKDFVSLNRNLSGRTRPKVTTKEENSKFVPERKAFNGRVESLPQLRSSVRKRRTNNLNGQVECRGFLGSTPTKSRSIPCDSLTGKGLGLNALPMNRTCVRSKLVGPREGNGATKSNSNDVISFTFNSPIRQKPGSSSEMVEKTMDDNTNKSFQQPVFLKGDSIAALLEQKLKELTSQEDDELAIGGPPKKSTAMILQELISALTAERPDIASPSIVQTKHEGSAGVSHVIDHLSPGSVLEASFSSSSLDESSGHMVYTDSVDYSSDIMHNLEPDTDLVDSATSLRKETIGCERVTALISNVSRILDSINFDEGRLTESKLVHAKDVMVNAELLFGNVTLYCVDGMEGLFIGPILFDLETVANVAWTNINVFTNGDANKTGNQFKIFLFDCLVECLDSKYGQYTNSKLEAWTRCPSCMNRERIIGELENEMNKWTSLAGMIPDEIVEWEMSHGLGKWTSFDIEAFEAGDEVCCDIFQALVDETLIDLWECRRGSF
ncbi:DnaA initiator-associating protein [Parasponia andersonii]|uniref:DnaA initiator-associating protein n=1 Tax=Parasponia andersonii TaxID=3476 RepID=A0A2P5B1V0_PARAD|nr:DnaA initiator-associating protein [Parasponia andersonii]